MFKSKTEGVGYSKSQSNVRSQQRTLDIIGILEVLYWIRVCMRKAGSWSLLLLLMILRWVEMKLELVIEESQSLEMHLNLIRDLTGSVAKMFSTTSCGRWFFLCRRIKGWGPGSIFRQWEISVVRRKRVIKYSTNLLGWVCWASAYWFFFFFFFFF